MMLQQDEPDDYVIATGETHTIREFLDVAFRVAGYDDWAPYVQQDPRFERPAEVDLLIGDATKAREKLGWEPKVDFEELVRMMYEDDLAEETRARPRPVGARDRRAQHAARRRDHGQRLRPARDAGRGRRARRVRRAARGARRVGAPHARRDVRVRAHRRRPRPARDHRRRRRRRAPAGHDRVDDVAAR